MDPRQLLLDLFDVAVAAAQPERVLAGFLPEPPAGRTIVVGAGKAAAAMAAAMETAWPAPLQGLVVTRYGHAVPTRQIEVVEAAHPVPDANGLAAAQRILALAGEATAQDLVVCLISGGASALLTLPVAGVTLPEKQQINAALLRSGATIQEMNTVRKALSAIKGGRLGAAIAPAPALTLLISDVPGDDPAVIGSGPTVADPQATGARAVAVLDRYDIAMSTTQREAMLANSVVAELPANQRVQLIAAPGVSLRAAAEKAQSVGVLPIVLGDAIEGEAAEVAAAHAATAGSTRERGPQGCVLLSGGETTVTLGDSGGRGGRNTEFLLALAPELRGQGAVYALAADTDGIDGSETNAGAVLTPDSLSRAAALGLDPRASLQAHDSWGFFAQLDDLVVTGPTHTNVNDFRAIYLPP